MKTYKVVFNPYTGDGDEPDTWAVECSHKNYLAITGHKEDAIDLAKMLTDREELLEVLRKIVGKPVNKAFFLADAALKKYDVKEK